MKIIALLSLLDLFVQTLLDVNIKWCNANKKRILQLLITVTKFKVLNLIKEQNNSIALVKIALFGTQKEQVLAMNKHTIVILLKEPDLIKEQHNLHVVVKQTETGIHKIQVHANFKVLTAARYKIQMVLTPIQLMSAYVSMVIVGTFLVQHALKIHQADQQSLVVWLVELAEQQRLLSLQLL